MRRSCCAKRLRSMRTGPQASNKLGTTSTIPGRLTCSSVEDVSLSDKANIRRGTGTRIQDYRFIWSRWSIHADVGTNVHIVETMGPECTFAGES